MNEQIYSFPRAKWNICVRTLSGHWFLSNMSLLNPTRLRRAVIDLFAMRDCLGCGQPLISQEQHLCLRCQDQLVPTHFAEAPQTNELYQRLAGFVPIEAALAGYYFDKGGTLQRLLRAVKYDNQIHLGHWLGRRVAKATKHFSWPEGTMVVPVPLHKKRLRQRGYNQAEKIAEGFGSATGLSLAPQLLKRTRHSLSQTKVGAQQRLDNVRDAFEAPSICPASVLLLDDVITTGATMQACIQALMAAKQPPQSIYVVSVAMARL